MWPLVRCLSLLSQLASLNSPGNYFTSDPSPLPISSMATPTSLSGPPHSSLFQSTPRVSETCCKLIDEAVPDRHTHIHTQADTDRHTLGYFEPTWARFWAGFEAHGKTRPCRMWLRRSRCVCVCVMSNKSESFHVLFCVIAVRREVLACIACVSSCVFKKGGNGRLSLPLSLSLLECEANGQSPSVQSFSLSFAVEPY